jgi:hypothetical protein
MNASPVAAKIALYRSLFRGRDDVYPRLFESRKTGKPGYSPACANEWVREVCDKRAIQVPGLPEPAISARDRRGDPPTSSGQDPSWPRVRHGLYPMLLDETCFFLAMDFDQGSWQEDVGCRSRKLPSIGASRSAGTIPIGQRRPPVAILRGGHSGRAGQESSGHTFSPRRWSDDQRSGSLPTTASFRTRTPCPRAASGT